MDIMIEGHPTQEDALSLVQLNLWNLKIRLSFSTLLFNLIYNPPEKIQDIGLWASKMRLGLVSFEHNGSENSESQKK